MPKTKKKDGVEQIVAKAFAHPLRVQILIILNERVASPNLLSQELDQSLNLVAYHVRVLEKYDCIELVDTKQRRGATEHFYRATRRQFLSDSELGSAAREPATRTGRSDAQIGLRRHRGGRPRAAPSTRSTTCHLSRTPMVVDKQGWSEVVRPARRARSTACWRFRPRPRNGSPQATRPGILSKVELLHFKSPDSKRSRRRSPTRLGPTQPLPSNRAAPSPAPLRS